MNIKLPGLDCIHPREHWKMKKLRYLWYVTFTYDYFGTRRTGSCKPITEICLWGTKGL